MDPEAFLDMANQVIKLKMFPYFDIAHSVLCALHVREDLGPGKPKPARPILNLIRPELAYTFSKITSRTRNHLPPLPSRFFSSPFPPKSAPRSRARRSLPPRTLASPHFFVTSTTGKRFLAQGRSVFFFFLSYRLLLSSWHRSLF